MCIRDRVIPAVVGVVLTKRTGVERIFNFPAKCPECETPVIKTQASAGGGVDWRCPNPQCPAQVRGRLEHWCSRGAMDIEGGGEVLAAMALRKFCADFSPMRSSWSNSSSVIL